MKININVWLCMAQHVIKKICLIVFIFSGINNVSQAQSCDDIDSIYSIVMKEILIAGVPENEILYIGRETVDFRKSSVSNDYLIGLKQSLSGTLKSKEMDYLKKQVNNPKYMIVPSNILKLRPNTFFTPTINNYSGNNAYENAKTWTIYFSTPIFIRDYCIIGTGLYYYGEKGVTTEIPIIEYVSGGYIHEFCIFLQKENGSWVIKNRILESIT